MEGFVGVGARGGVFSLATTSATQTASATSSPRRMATGGPLLLRFAWGAFLGRSGPATGNLSSAGGSCGGGGGGVLDAVLGLGSAGSAGGEEAGCPGGTASRLGNTPGTWSARHQWDQPALRTMVSGRTTPAETAARNCSADKGPTGRSPLRQNQESLGAEAMLSHHPRRAEPSQPEFPHDPILAPRPQGRNVSGA